MPVVVWKGVSSVAEAAAKVGPRLRQIRMSRGLTIRDLAERAKTTKNTVLRIEQGHPIAEAILHRLCDSLQTILPNLLVEPDQDPSPVRVFRNQGKGWRIAFRRQKAPEVIQDFAVVDDPAERARLGRLGYVSGFVLAHPCVLPEGSLQAAEVELYGAQEVPGFRHSGEEYILCLSGQLRLTLDGTATILNPGESATFRSGLRHRYESAHSDPSLDPVRALMVWHEAHEESRAVSHDEECDLV